MLHATQYNILVGLLLQLGKLSVVCSLSGSHLLILPLAGFLLNLEEGFSLSSQLLLLSNVLLLHLQQHPLRICSLQLLLSR